MALISCPECGEKISSKSEHCIHCGYKFKVCPECESVLESDATFCSECGFEVDKNHKNQNESPSKKTDSNSFDEMCNLWKKQSIKINILNNKVFKTILNIAECTLMIYLGVALWQWFFSVKSPIEMSDYPNYMDYLNALSERVVLWTTGADNLIEKCTLLFWIFIVISKIETIFMELADYYFPVDFYGWTKENKIDPVRLIKNGLKTGYSNSKKSDKRKSKDAATSEDLEMSISSFSYFSNPINKSKHFNATLINIVFSLLKSISLGLFVSMNFKGYIEQFREHAFVLGNDPEEFTFQSFEIAHWYLLIIFVVLLIAGFIYRYRINDEISKSNNKWAEENLGDDYDLYKKYILQDLTSEEITENFDSKQKDEKDRWDHRV